MWMRGSIVLRLLVAAWSAYFECCLLGKGSCKRLSCIM